MIAVVITPTANAAMAAAFLPGPSASVTIGETTFRIYDTPDPMPDQELRDPIDGTLLIGCRSFATVAAANGWIRETGVVQ